MANGDEPFDVAAYRTRRGVRPESGRKEGLATLLAGQYVQNLARGLASLPQRATQAAGSLQYGGSYDPGPALEAAGLVMGGTRLGAPRGAVGVGPPKTYLENYPSSQVTLPKGPPEGVTPIKPSIIEPAAPWMTTDVWEQIPRRVPFGVPERGQAAGFNVPAVHGTRRYSNEVFYGGGKQGGEEAYRSQDFGAFELPLDEIGIHFGTPRAAQDILGGDISKGAPRKFPVALKAQNPLEMKDLGVWTPSRVRKELERLGFDKKEIGATKSYDYTEQAQALRDLIRSKGYDSIKYENKVEDPGSTSYVVLDPSQIRSPWAAFDPAKASSGNILSGLAGAGVTGLGVLNSSRDLGPPRRESDSFP